MGKEIAISVASSKSVKKLRDSNLELFRIITMLLIVAHHFVVNSGLIEKITEMPFTVNSVFLLIFGAWGKTGINCFLMITGYFMCKSNITLNKYLKLLLEIYFYRIIISALFWITGYEAFSIGKLANIIIPVNRIEQNFTSCYIVFYLLIPFINILIKNLTQKQYICLIGVLFFVYTVFGTVHRISFNYVSWFAVVYIISAYIRLYPNKLFESKKAGWIMLLCIILMVLSVISLLWLGKSDMAYYFTADSNSFLPLITSVSAFIFFKNIKLKYSKIINTMAASTFGVLLIHANSDTMRIWLWRDTLDNIGHFASKFMPVYAVFCVLAIFIVCVIVDQIRINLIEKHFFNKFGDKIDEFQNSILRKI